MPKTQNSWYEKLRSMTVDEAAEFYAKGNYEQLMVRVCNVCGKFEREKEACMQEDCIHCIEATKKVLLSQYAEEEVDINE